MIDINMTAEERAANVEKARLAREAKKELFMSKAHLLKSDFADKGYWRKLASKFGVRMPSSYIPSSEVKLARRAMKRSGVTPDVFKERVGMNIAAFSELNSTWPAFAIVGIILEIADEIDQERRPNSHIEAE